MPVPHDDAVPAGEPHVGADVDAAARLIHDPRQGVEQVLCGQAADGHNRVGHYQTLRGAETYAEFEVSLWSHWGHSFRPLKWLVVPRGFKIRRLQNFGAFSSCSSSSQAGGRPVLPLFNVSEKLRGYHYYSKLTPSPKFQSDSILLLETL